MRRVFLQSAAPNKSFNRRICLAHLKKNDSMGALTKKPKNSSSVQKIQYLTQKNMKSIIGSLKRSKLGRKARLVQERKVEWWRDQAQSDMDNRHQNAIYLRARLKPMASAKQVHQPPTHPTPPKPIQNVDIAKLDRFRACLREKYRCRVDANQIFKEWDRDRRGKVGVEDIARISKAMGYDLSRRECGLLLAFEDHKDKGHMLPFELLRFVFGDPRQRQKREQRQSFERTRQSILAETGRLRREEQKRMIEGLVRKNGDFIIRELQKTFREDEKKRGYRGHVRQKYLELVQDFEEKENKRQNEPKPRTRIMSERKSPLRKSKVKNKPVWSHDRTVKAEETGQHVNIQRLLEVLGKLDGFMGRKRQLRQFADNFVDEDKEGLVDTKRLFTFLRRPKPDGKSSKRKDTELKRQGQKIGRS